MQIDSQDVPSASGDNDPITTKERKRVDSLSQQSSTRARASSFIQDTENPEMNRSGSLVRARAPSFIDNIRDSVSSLISTFKSCILNVSVHNIITVAGKNCM